MNFLKEYRDNKRKAFNLKSYASAAAVAAVPIQIKIINEMRVYIFNLISI